MRYRNALEVLPEELIAEIQKYASGEMIYIPEPDERKKWGDRSGARGYYTERNTEIREKRRAGASISDLAEEYGLSTDSIRRILYK